MQHYLIALFLTAQGANAAANTATPQPGWFTQHAAEVQAVAAVLQFLTAVAVVWLTYQLVRITGRYADLTRDSLVVATAQFEREYLPNWHLLLKRQENDGTLRLLIKNLSKSSVVVTNVSVRCETPELGVSHLLEIDLPLESLEANFTPDLTAQVNEAVRPQVLDRAWNGTLGVRLVFELAGAAEARPTEWFGFRVAVRDDRVIEAKRKRAAFVDVQEGAANRNDGERRQ